jgi:hypothetical protein
MLPGDPRAERVIRQSGLIEALGIARARKHQLVVEQVVDRTGHIIYEAAKPFQTALRMDWSPGDGGRKRAQQAGMVVLLSAYAETPPSTGNCIVTLTAVSAVEGEQELGTCQITNGSSIGEIAINRSITAGTWLKAVPITANGASGISISVTIKPL